MALLSCLISGSLLGAPQPPKSLEQTSQVVWEVVLPGTNGVLAHILSVLTQL